MRGRLHILAFLFGVGWVHTWSDVEHRLGLYLCLACTGLSILWSWRRQWATALCLCTLLSAFLFGAAYLSTLAYWRLQAFIPAADINKVSKVQVLITSLARLRPDSRQFHARVLQSQPEGLPENILLHWSAPGRKGPYSVAQHYDFPELKPGQLWSMSVLVKPVHGARNPHAFDYEQHLFAQGVRVLASVRGQPELLGEPMGWNVGIWAQRWRYQVRENMLSYVGKHRYGGVLLALAMGDQASIHPPDWELFNRAGLTHLVSISGAHVTLIAVLLAALVSYVWRRLSWRGRAWAEYYPAQHAASWAGLLTAFLYCILAGWGVPAQRTFLMLLVLVLARLSGMMLGPARVLLLAAWLVVLWDPWALLSSGFYLSFAAVAILLFRSYWQGLPLKRYVSWRRFGHNLHRTVLLQLLITVALFPLLAYLFHEISLVSPLTNAYAIPLIGSVLTPMALLLAFLASVPGFSYLAYGLAALADFLLIWTMHITQYLVSSRWAARITAAAPLCLMLWSLLGVLLISLPRGLCSRLAGVLIMLPALFYRPKLPADGQWQLTALDVGQGSSIVIRTRHQTLLYDAGVRYSPDSDEGLRSVLPYFRSQGIKQLDVLVLSHADLDHVGGASSVLQKLAVKQSWSGFDLPAFIRREERLLGRAAGTVPLPINMGACLVGESWVVDGVRFEFMWPTRIESDTVAQLVGNQKNSQSCVLSVRGKYHSALLLGDVGVSEELQMLAQGLPAHDVVLVGHHGSRSSSGPDFVHTMRAALAISQNGHWNRFSHPDSLVQARWEQAGSVFLRTDHDGAVQVYSQPDGLWYQNERERRAPYWALPKPPA